MASREENTKRRGREGEKRSPSAALWDTIHRLVTEHHDLLVGILWGLLGDDDEVADALQDLQVKLALSWAPLTEAQITRKVPTTARARAYLVVCAKNQALSKLRRDRRRPDRPEAELRARMGDEAAAALVAARAKTDPFGDRERYEDALLAAGERRRRRSRDRARLRRAEKKLTEVVAPQQKRTADRNLTILKLREQGVPIKKVAALYGVSQGRVSQICDLVRADLRKASGWADDQAAHP